MTAGEIERALFAFAPKELAQNWDNVGLLVGDPDSPVSSVLVALDITRAVVEEAMEGDFDLIVAHHPVMNCTWHPVQTVRMDDPRGWILASLLRDGISAICMHTNLDSAQGGVNDALAAKLGLGNLSPLCEDGLGRIGELESPEEPAAFARRVKEALGADSLRYAEGGRMVRRVAVGGGACGEFAPLAAAMGCDTFVTADLKYHDFQNAGALGLNLIDAGHFPTENPVCPVVARLLREQFPELKVVLSQRHRDVIASL